MGYIYIDSYRFFLRPSSYNPDIQIFMTCEVPIAYRWRSSSFNYHTNQNKIFRYKTDIQLQGLGV